MDDILVEGFPKNKTTLVMGVIAEYGGRVLAHVREMRAAVEEGGWVRGPGIALTVDRIDELLEAVRKLEDVAVPERVVAVLPLGDDQIRVGVQPFAGDVYAYVRRFYEDGEGKWRPTRKGVNIRTEFIDDLVDLVTRMRKAADDAGLLHTGAA